MHGAIDKRAGRGYIEVEPAVVLGLLLAVRVLQRALVLPQHLQAPQEGQEEEVMRNWKRVIWLLTLLLWLSIAVGAATLVDSGAYRMYRMLPSRPGPEAYSYACGISQSGTVAGSYLTSSTWIPYLWNSGSGSRQLTGLQGGQSSVAAVNDEGQAVGASRAEIGGIYGGPRPVEWDGAGNASDLGTLGGLFGSARDINSAGQVVGSAECASRTNHAFVWDPTTRVMQDLGTLGGNTSEADAINDRGEVAGVSYTGSETRLFRWDRDNGMQDLGTLDSQHTRMYASDINNDGQIVGSTNYNTYGGTRAWVFDDGRYLDLGLSGAIASGTNNHGMVVGWCRDASGYDQAFAWDKTGGVRLLGTPSGYHQSHAVAVNDDGWIVGSVWDKDGYYDALWEPVPEPSCAMAVVAGMLGLTLGKLPRRRGRTGSFQAGH